MADDPKKWLANRQRVLDFAERVYIRSDCVDLATVGDCAKSLRLSVATVLQLADDNQADGTMMVNTGIACNGAFAALRYKSEWTLEAWTEQADAAWRRAMHIPPDFDRGIADAFAPNGT